MSGQSGIPSQVAQQSGKCAVINLIPYLDLDQVPRSGMTVQELIDYLGDSKNGCSYSKETYQALKDAVANDKSLQNLEIVHTSNSSVGGYSSGNSTDAWKDDMIQACTVRDADGNYYVAYRGTGDGRWPDNGYGLAHETTPMQEAARDYFDAVAEQYLIDAAANGAHITVTGHSKGGNEAQFVYMDAKYAYLIDDCYNLDGQGFSEMAIERFKERWGDDYKARLRDMYSICGENDFVHDLGIVIIPGANTYYVTTSGEGIASYHALENMFNGGTLVFYDENGNPIQQGELGRFVHQLSETIMALPPAEREGVCLAVMELVDAFFDQNLGSVLNGDYERYRLLGEIDADPLDYLDLLVYGIPAIIGTAVLTEEGRNLIGSMLMPVLENVLGKMVDRFGPAGTAAILVLTSVIVGAVILPKLITFLAETWLALFIVDVVWHAIERIVDAAQRIYACCQRLYEAAVSFINKVGNLLRDFFQRGGAKISDHFIVDTVKMRSYAQRLQTLNGRIAKVDRRMDKLYWRVGLVGIYKLMKADLLTGYSWRLLRCAGYLNDSANEFEAVERQLSSSL